MSLVPKIWGYLVALLVGVLGVGATVLGVKRKEKRDIKKGQDEVVSAVELADREKQLEALKSAKEIEDEINEDIKRPSPGGIVSRLREQYGKTGSNDK